MEGQAAVHPKSLIMVIGGKRCKVKGGDLPQVWMPGINVYGCEIVCKDVRDEGDELRGKKQKGISVG